MRLKEYVPILGSFLFSIYISAQPAEKLIKVIVAPNEIDWTYAVGEQAEFSITVLKNNIPMKDVMINYTIEPEAGLEQIKILDSGVLLLKDGKTTIKAKRFNEPGFLRCRVTVEVAGKEYSSFATAGFSPEKIVPTTTLPSDFKEFWNKGKEALSEVPMNPVLTLLPDRCTDKVDVYHVQLDNIKGKIYGVLCTPKKAGKYPGILRVPGAGVTFYFPNVSEAEGGFITFSIGIHGIPLTLDRDVYRNLEDGALENYWTFNLDDRDNAYFKRVYLGCIRAVDFIESYEHFDGENIGVTGQSQGGALSIITASLDSRIDYLAAFYPALSDITGFLHGRAGGWPQIFVDDYTNKPEKIATSKYYDIVNFARFLKVPGWYSWGYNDLICPPTSMHAAYNVITSKKELHIVPETGHWRYQEQLESKNKWLFGKLKKSQE